DGLIVESGSYGNLIDHKNSHFKSMRDTFNESMTNEEDAEVVEEEGPFFNEEGYDVEDEIEDIDEDPLEDGAFSDYESGQRRRSTILSASAVRVLSSGTATSSSTTSTTPILAKIVSQKSKLAEEPAKPKFSEAAENKTGKVEWEVYQAWIKAAGGMWIVLPVILFIIGPQVITLFSKYWLTDFWGTQGTPDRQPFYLAVYALLGALSVVVSFFMSIVPVIFNLKASKSVSKGVESNSISDHVSFKTYGHKRVTVLHGSTEFHA
ncbi:hypothetical protein ACHAWF_009540, partial [Thalassiosira exigua]